MTHPRVTILVCTYNRPREIRETLKALDRFVIYPRDRLHWAICDDASPPSYIEELKKDPFVSSLDPHYVVQPTNGGWGRNVNAGLRYAYASSPYVYFTEDDYVLTSPLDLRVGVSLLHTQRDISMLRYRSTAGIPLTYHQKECDVTALMPFYREYESYVHGRITYFEIDPSSPSLWIYSNGPHLKARKFHEDFGWYPVGHKLGTTEEMYAHLVKDRMTQGGTSKIAVLPDWVHMKYQHIGITYQHTEADHHAG